MRNVKRIKPYCDALASIWNMVPDWRLSQLMMNAATAYKNEKGHDFFYVEDEEFLKFLFDFVTKSTQVH